MKTVLLVDDYEPFREAARRVLERQGYRVVCAGDARAAVAAARVFPPDVVVTDYAMPNGDGEELLMALHEPTPSLPVIILTGYATESLEKKLLAQGAWACLRKPLPLQRLVEKVGEALKWVQTQGPFPDNEPVSEGGELRISFGVDGRVTVDLRSSAQAGRMEVQKFLGRFPWAWVWVDDQWRVTHCSPALEAELGQAPRRLDGALWRALESRGWLLPPLDEVYPAMGQCLRGAVTHGTPRLDGLGVLAVTALLPEGRRQRGVLLMFPSVVTSFSEV